MSLCTQECTRAGQRMTSLTPLFPCDVSIYVLPRVGYTQLTVLDGFRPDSLDPATVLKMHREDDSVTIESQGPQVGFTV